MLKALSGDGLGEVILDTEDVKQYSMLGFTDFDIPFNDSKTLEIKE